MRYGFTTGSCATAAAKAACYMLLSGKDKNTISIMTPKGIEYMADIVDINKRDNHISCAVIKDGGDDPDITSGSKIFAEVSLEESPLEAGKGVKVLIDGGEGVGRVTLPGLDQAVGNAAINRVPRQMIEEEIKEVCRLFDYEGLVRVIISVPNGRELAEKTFNPRLGIVGGISIIGTSGIVEPMSSQALIDTIRVELQQKKALGFDTIAVTPGNYGLDFMKERYSYDLDRSVKCSNFIGDTIDMAVEMGFSKMLMTGHIGKLIKVAGGMMNTHSKEGDCRMEILTSCALLAGADGDLARQILECVTTEEGVRILIENKLLEETMKIVMDKIQFYLNKRGNGKIEIETLVYTNKYGLLAKSSGAERMLEEII